MNPSYDVEGLVDLGAIGLVIGNNLADNFAIEFHVGSGVGSDTVSGAIVELDEYRGVVVKPNMNIGETVNIHVKMGRAYVSGKVKGGGFTIRDSSDGWVGGLGADIDFNDSVYGSIGYTIIDQTDYFNLGIGYRF